MAIPSDIEQFTSIRIFEPGGHPLSDSEPAPVLAVPETSDEERGQVQRQLGRCILRLQQYEMLGKSIMVVQDQSGSISTWQARQDARKEKISKMTLGMLLNEMKASWLARNGAETEEDDSDAPADLKEIWFRTRTRHAMDPAAYEQTIAAMEELVAMRNELVHHFLERFNLWETRGCADAAVHLEKSYDLVDRHMNELTAWARHMDEARQHMARALAHEEIQEFIFGKQEAPSVAPVQLPPTTEPDFSTVSNLLREAELAHARDGWMLLDQGIAFVSKRSGGAEFPSRYQCRTWRQVLKRSGAFDVEERALPDRPGTITAYRSKRAHGD